MSLNEKEKLNMNENNNNNNNNDENDYSDNKEKEHHYETAMEGEEKEKDVDGGAIMERGWNGKEKRNSAVVDDDDDDEEEAPAPPALQRSSARQISRVGAVSVAGIDATNNGSDALVAGGALAPPPHIDLPTAGDEENALREMNQQRLRRRESSEGGVTTTTTTTTDLPPPTSGTSAMRSDTVTIATTTNDDDNNNNTNNEQSSTNFIPVPTNVTATLVTDEEYEAELHRVILKTSVKASRVEPLGSVPDETDEQQGRGTKLWKNPCLTTILIFGTALLCTILLGFVVYLLVIPNNGTFLRGNDDRDGGDGSDSVPTAAPTFPDEYLSEKQKTLVKFLKNRSFDDGEALRKYASPQRTYQRIAQTFFFVFLFFPMNLTHAFVEKCNILSVPLHPIISQAWHCVSSMLNFPVHGWTKS